MRGVARISLALTSVLCLVSVAATANAAGGHFSGGHMGGGHMGGGHISGGHMAHIGHVGHGPGGHGHWGHHHGWYGPAFGVGFYEPYYSAYPDDGECYRVFRHHHWRLVCD